MFKKFKFSNEEISEGKNIINLPGRDGGRYEIIKDSVRWDNEAPHQIHCLALKGKEKYKLSIILDIDNSDLSNYTAGEMLSLPIYTFWAIDYDEYKTNGGEL